MIKNGLTNKMIKVNKDLVKLLHLQQIYQVLECHENNWVNLLAEDHFKDHKQHNL